MYPVFSELCNTSPQVYLAYLLACVGNGSDLHADSGIRVVDGVDGGSGVGRGVVRDVESKEHRQGPDGGLLLTFVEGLRALGVASSEVAADEKEVVSTEFSESRGKHYWRNRAAKVRRRLAKEQNQRPEVVAGEVSLSACGVEVQRDLRETRAKRLVAENRLAEERAKAALDGMLDKRASGVADLGTKLRELRLRDKLQALHDKRFGEVSARVDKTLAGTAAQQFVTAPVTPEEGENKSRVSTLTIEDDVKLRAAMDELVKRLVVAEDKLAGFTGKKKKRGRDEYGWAPSRFVDDYLAFDGM